MNRLMRPALLALAGGALAAAPLSHPLSAQEGAVRRPFGTLRDQAGRQQRWLDARMQTVLPALMRKYGVDMWVVPMREYNEDPVFSSLVSATTFAARRRTIYVFFDRGEARGVERIALGGSSQGGVFTAVRSTKPVAAAVAGRQAELWGDEQWQVRRKVVEERLPKVIAIDVSKTFAFSDGLSAGELQGMSEALGPIELQATTPVPEWGGQKVRSAQEEDVWLGGDGIPHWALRRQTEFHLVR